MWYRDTRYPLVFSCVDSWSMDPRILGRHIKSQKRNKFLRDVKSYQWDDPLSFKRCKSQLIRRCVPQEEYDEILTKRHSSHYGGHFGGVRITQKVLHC